MQLKIYEDILYEDILSMNTADRDTELVGVRVDRAKKKAELEIAELNEKIATMKAAINEACMQVDINFHDIIAKQDQLCVYERKHRQFNDIVSQMF